MNEGAPIVCCTVEMAPLTGDVLVLDEVQWADDDERGSAWTRLLLAGEYRDILLLGALDALPLVRNAFPDAEVKVFERKLPLEFVGERPSRRGSSPAPSSSRSVAQGGARARRRDQPSPAREGRGPLRRDAARVAPRRRSTASSTASAEVCVATDVLGHGVNLPCETLLFAETTKFDGQERRELLPWELAQIAGRAGRFGLVERGHVGVLTGVPWASARPVARRVGAPAARVACRTATSATGSSTPAGSGRGSPTSASTRPGSSRPR